MKVINNKTHNKNVREVVEMELKVKDVIEIEDGKHEGVIINVEEKFEPYEYTDIYVEESKTKQNLKFGCPTNPSIKSKLMRLLAKFTEIKPDMVVDPAKILVGKPVSFMTITEEGKEGKKYTRIIDESVNPKGNYSKCKKTT
jgi:hypothetical protein